MNKLLSVALATAVFATSGFASGGTLELAADGTLHIQGATAQTVKFKDNATAGTIDIDAGSTLTPTLDANEELTNKGTINLGVAYDAEVAGTVGSGETAVNWYYKVARAEAGAFNSTSPDTTKFTNNITQAIDYAPSAFGTINGTVVQPLTDVAQKKVTINGTEYNEYTYNDGTKDITVYKDGSDYKQKKSTEDALEDTAENLNGVIPTAVMVSAHVADTIKINFMNGSAVADLSYEMPRTGNFNIAAMGDMVIENSGYQLKKDGFYTWDGTLNNNAGGWAAYKEAVTTADLQSYLGVYGLSLTVAAQSILEQLESADVELEANGSDSVSDNITIEHAITGKNNATYDLTLTKADSATNFAVTIKASLAGVDTLTVPGALTFAKEVNASNLLPQSMVVPGTLTFAAADAATTLDVSDDTNSRSISAANLSLGNNVNLKIGTKATLTLGTK